MALVFDEYGHFEGIVTAGRHPRGDHRRFQEEEGDEPAFVIREDGSFLVSGWMPVDEFKDQLGVPVPKDAKYETVAGYILAELNHLPAVGETLRARAVAVRGARPRRPPHRQGAGDRLQLRPGSEGFRLSPRRSRTACRVSAKPGLTMSTSLGATSRGLRQRVGILARHGLGAHRGAHRPRVEDVDPEPACWPSRRHSS